MTTSEIQKSKPLSQFVLSHTATGIRRFFDLAATMSDIISLGPGEPEFTTPECIQKAGIQAIAEGKTGYSSNYGLIDFRRALAEEMTTRYSATYDPDTEIMVTVGCSEAVDLAVRVLVNPGDEVIIPEPNYVSYVPCVRFVGGVPVTVKTTVENEFCPLLSDIEAAITPKTKAIMLSYPCNPSGAVASRELLEGIVKLAVQHNLYIISDEIYSRLSYDVPHTCIASIPGAWERTFSINGFSKSYAMTGWRIGFLCAPKPLLDMAMRIHQFSMLCAPVHSQIAAIAALQTAEPDVVAMGEEMNSRRHQFVKGVNDAGLACAMPKGSFFAFPSVVSTGMSEIEFAEKLLIEEHVLAIPGSVFGTPVNGHTPGEGHLRCNYAVHPDKLATAIERIGNFVARLK